MVVEEWQSALLKSLAVGYRLIVVVAVVAETPVVVSVVSAIVVVASVVVEMNMIAKNLDKVVL